MKRSETRPSAIECVGVVKQFHFYQHRSLSLREGFIRTLLGRPLHIRWPEFRLSGFNLKVERGEAVALIGRNGSGKSTALRVIAGIYRPNEGWVRTSGRLTAVIELGAGFHSELTGVENTRLYGTILGLGGRELEERFPEIVAFAELGDYIEMPVKYYSSGMKARLAFSIAVCLEPEILLLDEVLAVGDMDFEERCRDRLRIYHRQGGTLVFTSHNLELVREFCTRALWIEAGQVRMEGEASRICAEYEASAFHSGAGSPSPALPG